MKFVSEMKEMKGSGVSMVEDGVPSHRSVIARKARSELGINSLTHPPSSPDLNPIEPLWFKLKNRVADIPGS